MTEANSSQPTVRILHLEDNENDHVLVKEMLVESGLCCEFSLARTREEFESVLRSGPYDLIISDYTLPSYDGLRALTLVRESSDTPFIFFSGTIGEEIAVESLKTGATDYVVKQRPRRLVAAVRRALQEVDERARLKQTEAALNQSEERFRIVARATNDVIWEWDLQTKRIWRSENFESVFGHRLEAGLPLPNAWTPFLHPDDNERILSSITALLAARGRIWWGEYRFRRADGSYASVLDRAFVLYDHAGQPTRMVGVTIDMTERKHAEDKIRQQAALLDKACDAILVCDLDDRVIFWNRSAERLHELLFDQLPLSFNEARKSVAELGEWTGEFHQIAKDGHAVVVQSSWTLVHDEDGRPKSKLIINTDITNQKQLEEQFLRAQRLEILGVLVGGIAHDLNNALAPILMGVGFLRGLPLPKEASDILATVQTWSSRC
jgi:PAS domain S-box-containing protein